MTRLEHADTNDDAEQRAVQDVAQLGRFVPLSVEVQPDVNVGDGQPRNDATDPVVEDVEQQPASLLGMRRAQERGCDASS